MIGIVAGQETDLDERIGQPPMHFLDRDGWGEFLDLDWRAVRSYREHQFVCDDHHGLREIERRVIRRRRDGDKPLTLRDFQIAQAEVLWPEHHRDAIGRAFHD